MQVLFEYLILIGIIIILIKAFLNKRSVSQDSLSDDEQTTNPEWERAPQNDVYSLYEKKNSVMTEREKRYFKQLIGQYGQDYYVFPQINIDKLVTPLDNSVYWTRNKINRKSVDFVIADKNTLETLMVVELDDYTHRWQSRQNRDAFVNTLLKRCGVRLERV